MHATNDAVTFLLVHIVRENRRPMWYLYLDESGDLGFNFDRDKTSKYLTICVFATSQRETVQKVETAVHRTLKKINRRKGLLQELKGTKTDIDTKKFFCSRMSTTRFGIYSMTLNKQRVYEELRKNATRRERLYNFIAKKVLEKIPFEQATDSVQLVVDKCKGKRGMAEFNEYVQTHLEGRVAPKTPVNIHHRDSCQDTGLSAVDLFCWGIYRRYEKGDCEWYSVYQDKVLLDEQYL